MPSFATTKNQLEVLERRMATGPGEWLASSDIPKLFINAEPGAILTGDMRELCRTWPNQTEVTVDGIHFIQEDSPQEIVQAISDWLTELRAADPS